MNETLLGFVYVSEQKTCRCEVNHRVTDSRGAVFQTEREDKECCSCSYSRTEKITPDRPVKNKIFRTHFKTIFFPKFSFAF